MAAAAEDHVLGRAIAREVREIVRANCTECHGPDVAKPKGDFGYVLDLRSVGANPAMIVPGQPDRSELYRLVRDEEMPGENAMSGPLTAAQKELIRRWIELGAPDPDAASAAAAAPAPPARPPRSPSQRTLRLLGEFHPATVHFPIALLLAAALAHLLGSTPAFLFCIRLSALAAPLAAVLGWLNADYATITAKSADRLMWHRWLGVSAAVLAVLSWWWSKKGGWRLRIALYGGALAVIMAGLAGGALAHGWAHYRW